MLCQHMYLHFIQLSFCTLSLVVIIMEKNVRLYITIEEDQVEAASMRQTNFEPGLNNPTRVTKAHCSRSLHRFSSGEFS